jgi:hypothetical protein
MGRCCARTGRCGTLQSLNLFTGRQKACNARCCPVGRPACVQGYANELANAETDEQLAEMVRNIMDKEGVSPGASASHQAAVVLCKRAALR